MQIIVWLFWAVVFIALIQFLMPTLAAIFVILSTIISALVGFLVPCLIFICFLMLISAIL
jgi:hypothetical protein